MAKRLDLEFAFDAAIAQTQKCIETGLVTARGEEARIDSTKLPVRVQVIPVEEEGVLVRAAVEILAG